MSADPIDVLVPRFGHGLEEASLIEWVATVGDRVDRGDVVALIETEKASTEIVAEQGGRIAAHVLTAGAVIRTGEVLYRLAFDA